MNLSRRDAVIGAVCATLGVAALRSVALGGIQEADFAATAGAGTELTLLQNQIAAFFGTTSQRLLPGCILNEYDGRVFAPRALIYSSFEAIYGKGPVELDTIIANGMRMIVRFLPHNAMLKALLFIGVDGSTIEAAAISYYDTPAGGVDEQFAGKLTHFGCANTLSVETFFQNEIHKPVLEAVVEFFKNYPMPGEQMISEMLRTKGPKVKFLAGRV